MSGIWNYIGALFVLAPTVGLLLIGIVIALRSGVVNAGAGTRVALLASNLSWTVLRVLGYLAGLAVVQKVVGLEINLGW